MSGCGARIYAGAIAATWRPELLSELRYHDLSAMGIKSFARAEVVLQLLRPLRRLEQGRACVDMVEIGFGIGETHQALLSAVDCLQLLSVDALPKRLATRYRARFGNRSHFWQMDSQTAAHRYPGSPDLLFLDGGHLYDTVRRDLEAWWPKLRSGGTLAGHDYNAPNPGVVQAVNEFVYAQQLTLHLGVAYTWWVHVP